MFDVPTIEGTVIFEDGCEGSAVQASLSGNTTGPIEWVAKGEASINASNGNSAEVLLPTDGSLSAEISATISNECGVSASISSTNTISLKPKEIPVIESKNGNNSVCETKNASFSASSSDALNYTWKWVNDEILVGAPIDDELTLTSTDFSGLTNGSIEVIAVNACGEGVSGFKVLTVLVPEVIDIDVKSDKNNNEFCIEEDNVRFTADSKSFGELEYEFSIGTQIMQAASANNEFEASIGDLTDGTTVKVEVRGDSEGCFIATTAMANITMKGFNQPIVTLVSNSDKICESKDDITLTIEGLRKGDEVSTWTFNANIIKDYTANDYVASKATDKGEYEVEVVNAVCVQSSVVSKSIMIYEQPTIQPFSFLTTESTLILEFDEFETPISDTKVVLISGLLEGEGLTDSYRWIAGGTDLEFTANPDNDFSFTANKGIDDSVTFIVTNGVEGAMCSDSLSFYIKDIDAVGLQDTQFVSNALYPNPVAQGQDVMLNSEYVGAIVEVFTTDGDKVFSKKMKESTPLKGLTSGKYVVKIKKEGQVFVSKLIVE